MSWLRLGNINNNTTLLNGFSVGMIIVNERAAKHGSDVSVCDDVDGTTIRDRYTRHTNEIAGRGEGTGAVTDMDLFM
jgi:hypothetical protein